MNRRATILLHNESVLCSLEWNVCYVSRDHFNLVVERLLLCVACDGLMSNIFFLSRLNVNWSIPIHATTFSSANSKFWFLCTFYDGILLWAFNRVLEHFVHFIRSYLLVGSVIIAAGREREAASTHTDAQRSYSDTKTFCILLLRIHVCEWWMARIHVRVNCIRNCLKERI